MKARAVGAYAAGTAMEVSSLARKQTYFVSCFPGHYFVILTLSLAKCCDFRMQSKVKTFPK